MEAGSESRVPDYTQATRGDGVVINKAYLLGGNFHELIFRHMFNLKCLLNIQVEMSSRKLTMGVWSAGKKSRLGLRLCLHMGGL